MREAINGKYMGVAREHLDQELSIQTKGMVVGHLASFNEYYPLTEKQFHIQLACAGLDTAQPFYMFDGDRFVAQYKLRSPFMGKACDAKYFVEQNDIRVMIHVPGRRDRINERIERYSNFENFFLRPKSDFLVETLHRMRVFDDYWFGREGTNAIVYHFTTYFNAKQLCL